MKGGYYAFALLYEAVNVQHIVPCVSVLTLLDLSSVGARKLYNPHEILLRRKLEEQAELQQAIELQERRLMNLHLPDFKNNHFHHQQCSLSFGTSVPLSQLHGHVGGSSLYSDSTEGDITGWSINSSSMINFQ